MSDWFKVIKVEDIAFDDAIEGFGLYSAGLDTNTNKTFEMFRQFMMSGKSPAVEDFIKEEIRINHKNVYRYLKAKLGKKPNEQQITNYIIRVIMHEGTHAGMGLEQANMTQSQSEYGAFVGQFPQSTYYRIKQFLTHPEAGSKEIIPEQLAEMFNMETGTYSPTVDRLKNMIAFVEAMTDDLPESRKEEAREKLIRLELNTRKSLPTKNIREIDDMGHFSVLVERYGSEHVDFIESLYVNSDQEEKMAATVTTTSAPAMFNKVVRGRKKKRDD